MPEETRSFLIDDPAAGKRLDHFLTLQFNGQSRSSIRRWIDRKCVLVNDQWLKAGYALRPGDRVDVQVPRPEPSILEPEDIPLQIVYEDESLVVIDKPAGLVVHPGAGNRSGTLANALLYHFRTVSRDSTVRPGIVHRLDKATSGLLVVAKKDQVHEFLADQFKMRSVEKEYLTLVYGHLEPAHGQIDLPLGRDPHDRIKVSTRSRHPRSASTTYQVEHYRGAFSYLRVRLHTGRTHQIRVHLQSLGHPVVGDELYGRNRWKEIADPGLRSLLKSMGRHFLHATQLSFRHPSGKQLSFQAALPPELVGLLERLG